MAARAAAAEAAMRADHERQRYAAAAAAADERMALQAAKVSKYSSQQLAAP